MDADVNLFLSSLEFFVSPIGVLLLVGIFFGVMKWIMIKNTTKRYLVLKEYFQGVYSYWRGLEIHFKGYRFRFSAIGKANGSVDYGGIALYPTLWGYVETPGSFFCAHKDIEKYEFSWSLGWPALKKHITVNGKELVIGADSEGLLSQLEEVLLKEEAIFESLTNLFALPADYLAVKNEIHFGKSVFFSREWVFRYFGFPATVYTEPTILEEKMKNVIVLLEKMGVRFEKIR